VTLGQTIKLQRKKKGWKQEHLSKRLGISYMTLSAIERDKRTPGGPLLHGLARELETTVEFLVNEDPRFNKIAISKAIKAPITDTDAILKSLPILIYQGQLTVEQVMRASLSFENKKITRSKDDSQ
jgi:transcriptional regulator with XRE-family HTH domain